MNIKNLKVGPLQTNCYILTKDSEVLVIDPGDDADFIIEHIDGKLVGILLTHHHFDHVGALKELLNQFKVDVYDKDYFKDEKEYKIGKFTFAVIHTPGHTKDSISYYFKDDKVLFSGDFLFKEEIGRVDLPGGSEKEMISSLQKIYQYPDDLHVYPGHEDDTTLGYEKENNQYLREYGKNGN